jgi:hypothetical protein
MKIGVLIQMLKGEHLQTAWCSQKPTFPKGNEVTKSYIT